MTKFDFKDRLVPFDFDHKNIDKFVINNEEYDGIVVNTYLSSEQINELIVRLATDIKLDKDFVTENVSIRPKTQIVDKTHKLHVNEMIFESKKQPEAFKFFFIQLGLIVPTLSDVVEYNAKAQEIYSEKGVYGWYGLKQPDHIKYTLERVKESVNFGYDFLPTISMKAAFIWYKIAKFQSFNNGNKRTAMVTTLIFLHSNKYDFQYRKHLKKELVEKTRYLATLDKMEDKDYKDFGNYILNNTKINYDNSEWNLLEKLRDDDLEENS
ncbi:type II toxin-antitoxin system death-on-curing family toxin [Companilactobacillus furfuricola]|uniref:type II toxin-antitoxin system death-on-curing family toxin n=1 Tax=Companilactobacillus furfuricola TaxID=1462575 RepID=UPI000F7A24FD|nr:type II toxin-antitoxin system death-on-curing family toxin [Companilactobacillus furfuricola]